MSQIFDLTCNDFDKTMECLQSGPQWNVCNLVLNILKLMSEVSRACPVVKVHIDEDEAWSDLVLFYNNM